MTARVGRPEWPFAGVALIGIAALLTGCRANGQAQPVRIANPALGPITVAVAPAVNLSGSTDFDPARFADLMASELSYADGISVIPVSRVLGVLAAQGTSGVESPEQALGLTRQLGADAVLVFAVTEYDPYDPPSIGISAQLYGERPWPRRQPLDPVALARQPRPDPVDPTQAPPRGVLAQTQRVFDASHESVATDIREFASLRGGDDSPYGWRKYVVSQEHFIRYCCYATVRGLLNEGRAAALAGAGDGSTRKP